MSLDHVLRFGEFTLMIAVAFALVGIGSYAFLPPDQMKGVLGGFALFSANVWILAYLAKLIFQVIAVSNSTVQRSTIGFALGLGMIKFILLAVALYVMIVTFKLSGLMVFLGSMIALVFLCSYFVVTYLKFLGKSSTQQSVKAS